jgi:hypothetical protein
VTVRAASLAAALAAALCGTAAADSAADPKFQQLLSQLAAQPRGHVSFTEVHHIALLKEPLNSSGELFYEAPDRLEKRTLEPRPETLRLDHGILTAERGHRAHVLELSAYPQLVPFVESIRATLAGDGAALERYFVVDFSGELAHWKLHLTPRDPSVARSLTAIDITGEQAHLRTIQIRQSDGDESLLTIGPDIPP